MSIHNDYTEPPMVGRDFDVDGQPWDAAGAVRMDKASGDSALHVVTNANRAGKLHPRYENDDPMPEFPLKAKDMLAIETITFYRAACLAYGLDEQAAQVELAVAEFREWQARNPDRMKLPDHEHVPVVHGG